MYRCQEARCLSNGYHGFGLYVDVGGNLGKAKHSQRKGRFGRILNRPEGVEAMLGGREDVGETAFDTKTIQHPVIPETSPPSHRKIDPAHKGLRLALRDA